MTSLPQSNQNWGWKTESEFIKKLALANKYRYFATSILVITWFHSSFLFIYACIICWSTSPSRTITEQWWCTRCHRPLWSSKTLVTLNGPLSISTTYIFMVTQAMSVSTRALTSRTWKSNPCSQLNANCQLCITALYLWVKYDWALSSLQSNIKNKRVFNTAYNDFTEVANPSKAAVLAATECHHITSLTWRYQLWSIFSLSRIESSAITFH